MFEKISAYVANALGIGVEKGAVEPPRDSPPRPKWQPTIAVDIERTAKTLDGLAEGEVLLNANKERNQFDRLGKIALFGRTYMFMDAISPWVVKVCRQNVS